jgi:putative membrane protein
MIMHPGFEHGGAIWLAILLQLVFWIGLVAVIVWLVLRLQRTPPPGAPPGPEAIRPESPEEILARRLANGDIEPDDYERRLAALRSPPPKT